jgi:hypothetical protein
LKEGDKQMKPKFETYVLSLSFGNYLKGDGGTDKVIAEHQRIMNQNSISYIQIAPVGKNPQRRKKAFYTIVIDGRYNKVVSEESVFNFLNLLTKLGFSLKSIFIHHLLKFKLNSVKRLCDASKAPIIFYLHDYYSICPQYKLLNSNGFYCGENKISDSKCGKCSFYESAKSHYKEIFSFYVIYRDRLKIVAPSEAALNIWSQSYSELKLQTMVHPHQKQEGCYSHVVSFDEKLRVAYIGRMISAKGAELWKKFIKDVAVKNADYDCYYFGISDNEFENVKKVNVFVTPENPNAMVNALRENKIQVVFLWSIWPETYSYTYYEALASKCFIITSSMSGNIASMVKSRNNGKVFNSLDEAISYLEDSNRVKSDITELSVIVPENLKVNLDILALNSSNNYEFKCDWSWKYTERVEAWFLDVIYRKKHMKGAK